MAEGLRRSNREPKPKKDQDFVYNDEFECFVPKRNLSLAKVWQPSSDSECSDFASASPFPCVERNWRAQTAPYFTFSDDLPIFSSVDNYSVEQVPSVNTEVLVSSQSQSQNQNAPHLSARRQYQFSAVDVNKNTGSHGQRRTSSTRRDFLDLEGNFLSCEAINIMSGEDSESAQSYNLKCNVCGVGEPKNCSVCASAAETPLARVMMAALDKIDTLSREVRDLNKVIVTQNQAIVSQNQRINKLENNSANDSCTDQGKSISHRKSKSKTHRVYEEKDRSH